MPIKVTLTLNIDATALKRKPELACHIAVIAGWWQEIEDEMAWIFAYAMETDPALAAMVFGRVNSMLAKLEMIEGAIAHSVSEAAAEIFKKRHREAIRKCASERNHVVHAHWACHPDYPDRLIRMTGLADPQLAMLAYDERDFLEIEFRAMSVLRDLKEFAQSLPDRRQLKEPTRSAWKLPDNP
jgi:hypothetical protein